MNKTATTDRHYW